MLFILLTLFGFANADPVISVMQDKIEQLSSENHYDFVDLDIPEDDFELIDRLVFKKYARFDHFGHLDLLVEKLSKFLKGVSEDDPEAIEIASLLIYKTACQMIEACGLETAWVCVKSHTPTPIFDCPRWHRDGDFYKQCSNMNIKLAVTLKGNPTLFMQLPDELRDEFLLHANDRNYLCKMLDNSQTDSAPKGWGTVYFTRDPTLSAVHTEPKTNTSRLFFSVVPGTKEEMDILSPPLRN